VRPGGDGWLDLTRVLHDGHPVWPGDAPFEVAVTARIPDGSSVNLLRISGTTHLGTHVDAPWHYDDAAARLDSVPLDLLIGEALLVEVAPIDAPIEVAELPDGPLPPRLLVRTGQPDAWERFPEAFRSFSAAAIDHLAAAGVRLLGTDAPSVDALTSRDLPAHHACGRNGVTIVEGLALTAAPLGTGTLACLPLRLAAGDGAPARAAWRPDGA
jgi:arylformamidase